MPNEQLVAYIKSSLAAGISKENIAQTLIKIGWQVADINAALSVTDQGMPQMQPSVPATAQPQLQQPISQPITVPQTAVHTSRKWITIGIVVVLLLLIGAGGVFAAYHVFSTPASSSIQTVASSTPMLPISATASSTSFTSTQQETGSGTTTVATTTAGGVTVGATVGVSVTADVKTTVSCGSADCFAKAFAACTPATGTADVGFASASYKIIGPANGGCKMTFEYPTNPNPAWVNQPMTCTFDNKLDLQTSETNVFNAVLQKKSNDCVGPLVGLLQNAQ